VLLDQDFIDIFAIDPRVAFGRADDAEVLKADKAMEGDVEADEKKYPVQESCG
jgi:hypothetical protein